MDAKDTWPVVKFIIAATGLKTQDARKAIEKIPKTTYSDLYLCARAWDRDSGMKATEQLRQILGNTSLDVLTEATRRAMTPSHMQDTDEPKPRKKSRK